MEVKEGYRQTDIGVIPEDWSLFSLLDLCVDNGLIRGPFGGTLKKELFVKDGFKVYEQRNAIYQDEMLGTYYIDETKYNELKRFAVMPGDFIVSCSGTIGRIFQIPRKAPKGVINQALLLIRIDNKKIDDAYFFQYFGWDVFQDRITDSTQGGAMKNLVGMGVFRSTIIPLPPTIEEQSAIATALSDTDALITSFEKLIEKKCNIKKGAMQVLLTEKRRLPGFEKKKGYQQADIGIIPEDWDVKRLDELFSITAGGDLKKESFSNIKNEKHPYPIYSNSLKNKGLYGYSSEYEYDANCVTITARGTLGVANPRDYKFNAIIRVLVLSPIEKLDCVFMAEYVNNNITFSIESTGVPQLTVPQISKYKIVYPQPEEQSAIAHVLSDMDADIEVLEMKLAKYRDIKQGMMQELLTGNIRLVKGDS